jgi:hypothetical protein
MFTFSFSLLSIPPTEHTHTHSTYLLTVPIRILCQVVAGKAVLHAFQSLHEEVAGHLRTKMQDWDDEREINNA